MSRKFIILSSMVIALVAGGLWLLNRQAGNDSAASPDRQTRETRPSRPDRNSREMIARSRWSGLTEDTLPAHQRLDIARQITGELGPEDTAALFAAMDHTPRQGGEEDWYLILNEIMEQMRRHGLGSDEYADHLGKIISDSSRPTVVRDYAIQHLILWIGPGNPDQVPHERDPKAVAQSLDHIAKAIQEPAAGLDTVSGTALLGLADISPHLPPETIAATWASLGPYLHGVISGDSNAQLSTRVSAIQAVSLTGQRQYLEPIRSFAASEATEPSVRLSSIASLGFYADPEDQALLESIASQGSRFQYAAQSALKRFNIQTAE